jgi:membrane fusion protein, multidrug efflux system
MRDTVRRTITYRALLAALPLAACAEKKAPPPPPVPVTVAVAERRAIPFELPATGTVEPIQTVSVQGQVLFELDPRPYRSALQQASAILNRDSAQAANAAQEAQRYQSLVEKEYVTAQQYEEIRTNAAATKATLAASEAAVEQARLNLQYATIRAPISGRTGSLLIREGNLVRANSSEPLVKINQLRPIQVRFAVPATNLPLIQTHLSEKLVVRAEPPGGGDPAEGTLSFVDNAVDTSTGTILLKGRSLTTTARSGLEDSSTYVSSYT